MYSKSFERYKFKKSIKVPASMYGRIIGKGGSKIRQMEFEFNVRLDLQRSEGQLIVLGDRNDSVEAALRKIQEIMNIANGESNQQSNQRQVSNNNRNMSLTSEGSKEATEPLKQWKSVLMGETNGIKKPINSQLVVELPEENKSFEEKPLPAGLIDWNKVHKQYEEECNKKWAKFPPLEKKFYKEDKAIASLSVEEVKNIRMEKGNISVKYAFDEEMVGPTRAASIPNPVLRFEQCFSHYAKILEEIKKQGFEKPTPIQSQAWPVLLSGMDMIGIAQTGTGKTLAYILPGLIHAAYRRQQLGLAGQCIVLVLTPTRELAQQVHREVEKYSYCDIRS